MLFIWVVVKLARAYKIAWGDKIARRHFCTSRQFCTENFFSGNLFFCFLNFWLFTKFYLLFFWFYFYYHCYPEPLPSVSGFYIFIYFPRANLTSCSLVPRAILSLCNLDVFSIYLYVFKALWRLNNYYSKLEQVIT